MKSADMKGTIKTLINQQQYKWNAIVTLKGKPNTILSGTLKVHAAPITHRKIGNQDVYQLTGGYSNFGWVAAPKVSTAEPGRKSLAYNPPYIIAYLRQRNPYERISDVEGATSTVG